MASPSICCVDVSQESELDHNHTSLVTSDIGGLLDSDDKPGQLSAGFDFSEDSCRFEPECILSCPSLAISEDHTPHAQESGDSESSQPHLACLRSVSYGGRFSGPTGGTSCVSVCTDTALSSKVLFTSPSTSMPVADSANDYQVQTKMPASHAQPVIIGSVGAAAFVSSVLKDLKPASTGVPSVEDHSQGVKGSDVSPGYVLLSRPTIVPGLVSIVQTEPGSAVSGPVFIQLAPDIVLPPASTSVLSTGIAGTVSGSAAICTPTFTQNIHSSAHSFQSSVRSTQSSCAKPGAVFDTVSKQVYVSDTEHHVSIPVTQQAVVIGCLGSSSSHGGGKGMHQILNHFLQQNSYRHPDSQKPKLDEDRDATAGQTCVIKEEEGMMQPAMKKKLSQASSTASVSSQSLSPGQNLLGDCAICPDWSRFPVQGNNPLVLIVKEANLGYSGLGPQACVSTEPLQLQTSTSVTTLPQGSTSCHMDFGQQCDMSDNTLQDEVDGASRVSYEASVAVNDSQNQASVASSSSAVSETVTQKAVPGDAQPGCSPQTGHSSLRKLFVVDTDTGSVINVFGTGEEKEEGQVQHTEPKTVKETLSRGIVRPIIMYIVQEDGSKKKVSVCPSKPAVTVIGQCEMSSEFHITTSTKTGKQDDAETTPQSITADMPSEDTARSESQGEKVATCSQATICPTPSVTSSLGSKSKRYSCDLCTATFSRFGNYTRHKKIHTLNPEEDKCHRCPYCDRSFLQRCDMKRHLLIHTNQEPFRCKTCGKGYIRKSDLVVHERFHAKEPAFKCEECGRRFYQSGDLRRHKRAVHAEQTQLMCGHCHRKYAREVTLIRHMKTAHNDLLKCASEGVETASR